MAPTYRPELDGLRAVAVLAVMGFHFAEGLVSGGSLGVDVFFVLSGYLITSILASEFERTGRLDHAAFLMRRARRLLPGLAALLAAYWLLCPVVWPGLVERRGLDVAAAAFYVTNLRQTFQPADNPLSHTWSLAIEAQFYLLWPWALPALLRLPRKAAALLLCCAWASLTAGRFAWAEFVGGPGTYYFTPLHATGLLLGSALALRPVRGRAGGLALVALGALFIGGQTRQSLLYAVPAAEVLTAMAIAQAPRFLAARPLQAIGKASYGIYLWHIPIAWATYFPNTAAQALALAAASIAAGALSYLGVERRWLKPRRPARAAAAATVA